MLNLLLVIYWLIISPLVFVLWILQRLFDLMKLDRGGDFCEEVYLYLVTPFCKAGFHYHKDGECVRCGSSDGDIV